MKIAKVYLAGPIGGLSYKGCTEWREYAKVKLAEHNILGVSPMRAKDYLSQETEIDKQRYDQPLSTPKGLTTRDRFDILNSDIVIINLFEARKVSIGSMIEVGWADMNRKPVVLVMEKNNIHEHPMLDELAAYRVETLDEALNITIAILKI